MSLQTALAERASARWLPLLRSLSADLDHGCVWKNADRALEGDGDIDFCAPRDAWPAIRSCFERWASEQALGPVIECRHSPDVMFLVAPDPHSDALYELDVRERVRSRGGLLFRYADLDGLIEPDVRGFRRLRPGAEGLVKLVLHGTAVGGSPRPQGLSKERVGDLLRLDPEGVRKATALFGMARSAVARGADAFARGHWDRIAMVIVDIRTNLKAARSPRGLWARLSKRRTQVRCPVIGALSVHGRKIPGDREEWMARVAATHRRPGRRSHPPGRVGPPLEVATLSRSRGAAISIVGPDGSGKSTLIESLEGTALAGIPLQHMRSPGLLYRRFSSGGEPVTEPHAQTPYGLPLSILKLTYLFFDYLLAWALRVRPHLREGGWLILERGWWDMLVDPLRYRLARTARPWATFLGRLLPRVDMILVLEAPADIVYGRKKELDRDEIGRQIRSWRAVLPPRQKRAFLDGGASPALVKDRCAAIIAPLLNPQNRLNLASLPGREHPRWMVPTHPRKLAAGSLRIYHPITFRGLVGWQAARIFASLGAARLLPDDTDVTDLARHIERWVPTGGSVAVATTNHPERFILMALAPNGRPTAVGKLAGNEVGARALEREAMTLLALPPMLPPPLGAASVLEVSDRLLVQTPVLWRPRLRSWLLPAEVAGALGSFYASRERGADRGPTHGDCAPWNLFRTAAGWALVDWENAEEGGLPFTDVFHYLVQSHALLGRPSTKALKIGFEGRGWIGSALAAYSATSGVGLARAPDLFVDWLEQDAPRYGVDTPDSRICREARFRLLSEFGS